MFCLLLTILLLFFTLAKSVTGLRSLHCFYSPSVIELIQETLRNITSQSIRFMHGITHLNQAQTDDKKRVKVHYFRKFEKIPDIAKILVTHLNNVLKQPLHLK